jgi:hypothetical protein
MRFPPAFFLTKISPLTLSVQAALTKEGLRMFPGVIAHPRVVPREGAVISGTFIPGGVRYSFSLDTLTPSCPLLLPLPLPLPLFIESFFFLLTDDVAMHTQTVVGQSFTYVHRSPLMYERPEAFLPERWLGPSAKACDTALSVC